MVSVPVCPMWVADSVTAVNLATGIWKVAMVSMVFSFFFFFKSLLSFSLSFYSVLCVFKVFFFLLGVGFMNKVT